MNDYLFTILMQQRHGQLLAEIRAARAWQMEWQGISHRILNKLTLILKDREISTLNQVLIIVASQCVFSCYQVWMQGERICLSEKNVRAIGCPVAGYWDCNVATVPSEHVAHFLAVEEGLKASSDLICQWLANQSPYKREHAYVVIGPLRKERFQYLKTITFYVNPDQLSMLITGAEYCNASNKHHPLTAVYGSGCGQLAAMFADLDTPAATIGGTAIVMRPFLPRDTLAFTVTKSMFEQLCRLDENSFWYKSFWLNVKQSRINQSVSKGI